MTMTFEQARAEVLARVPVSVPPVEWVELEAANRRVLAEPVIADRDYPPAAKAMRDGFAVRSADLPGSLRCVGETAAGQPPMARALGPGEAIEIMTGALLPPGADQVVMVEHTATIDGKVEIARPPDPGANISGTGSECRAGETLVAAGQAITFATIALLASVGAVRVPVFQRPRVAILATGDEVVPVGAQPLPHQVRNSNVYSLAAQVQDAGGIPEILPVARDDRDETRHSIRQGLEADLLLLSGGVSAGKHDVVELALADLEAEFYFTRVLIQPGQPAVFGRCQGRFFFGLPGNPGSTMVTFLILAKAALERLAGVERPELPLLRATVARAFRAKPGLTRFLPARLSADGSELTPVNWRGSSDMTAIARGNCYLVTDPEKELWEPGDTIRILMR